MKSAHCKTLASALMITAITAALCLAAPPRALAQKSENDTKDVSHAPGNCCLNCGGDASSPVVRSGVDIRNLFSLLVVIVALAAYVRLRIDWSKDRIQRRHWLVPMLVVEATIALAGFMLVYRISSELLGVWRPAWLDGGILWVFLIGVSCLFPLLCWQYWFDYKWIIREAGESS